jgi:hypothetical protein
MINLKEEKTTTVLKSPSITQDVNPFELRKATPATVINLWVKSFKKWLGILERLKKEACLIDRLITISVMGEESGHQHLTTLQRKLQHIINSDIRNLEIEILDMEQNLDLLQRYVINTDLKMRDIKMKMQQFSQVYGDLKMKIFHELTHFYPMTIL